MFTDTGTSRRGDRGRGGEGLGEGDSVLTANPERGDPERGIRPNKSLKGHV